MSRYIKRIAALLPLALAACSAPAPHVERNLGMATTDLRNAQVIDPAAGSGKPAPTGMDGVAAKSAYDQYQKSFKAPEKNANTFLIGVGR
jgi:hypothetical protein